MRDVVASSVPVNCAALTAAAAAETRQAQTSANAPNECLADDQHEPLRANLVLVVQSQVDSPVDAALWQALKAVFLGRSDVRLAILFGSCARGTQRVDSDVDIAVLARDANLLALAAELSEAIGREVHLVNLEQAEIPLLDELIAEGITLHEAVPGAAATWRSHTLGDLEIDRPWFMRMQTAFLKRLAEKGIV